MKNKGRYLAVCLLDEYYKKASYANILINRFMDGSPGIDMREKRFAEELFYGVIANNLLLDRIISGMTNGGKKLPLTVCNVLRMSAYQLIFLHNIPGYAVCDEAVKIVKKSKFSGMAALVNAILRNLLKDDWHRFLPEEEDKTAFLSVVFSHPEWMVRRWIDVFGYENTKVLCEYNNSSRPVFLRVNTLKYTTEKLLNDFENIGFSVKNINGLPDAIMIESFPEDAGLSRMLAGGYAYIQDISAMMVSYVVNPQSDDTVIDCCAAPGGKLIHMAQLMSNNGHIICGDLHQKRVDLLRANINNYGVENATIEIGDALEWLGKYAGMADKVLLDAPCSGTGVIARKKDIKSYRKENDILALAEVQKKLLVKASECLKKNGVLVYSTCSLEKEENIQIIDGFLDGNSDFILSPIEPVVDYMSKFSDIKNGYINIYPFQDNSDGFFMAKIKKVN